MCLLMGIITTKKFCEKALNKSYLQKKHVFSGIIVPCLIPKDF